MSYLYIGAAIVGLQQTESAVEVGLPGIAIDLDRCIGCRACEVHCQLERGLPAAIMPMRVEGAFAPGVPFACAHCDDPPCAAICPAGAITKRPDGIVLLDESRCIGCRLCLVACPYGSPKYDAARGRAVKCDLCVARLDAGLWPACATKCSMKAIYFLDSERSRRLLSESRVRGGGSVLLGRAVNGGGGTDASAT